MATVRVWVLLVYRMMEELSSLIKVIQLMMAPESTPDIIMGTVTFTKDFVSVHPRLMAASSTLGLICPMMAVLERMVYGIRRMDREMTMMTAVPLSSRGLLLKAYRKEIPRTEPGIM